MRTVGLLVETQDEPVKAPKPSRRASEPEAVEPEAVEPEAEDDKK